MATFDLSSLTYPIVQAPMAGGPSTPALASAVSGAGGLGFLAAGYRAPEDLHADIEQVRSSIPAGTAFGVNLFVPGHGSGAAQVPAYAATLHAETKRYGSALGEPRWDDDRYGAKLDVLAELAVPIVSFTFGCPERAAVAALHGAGSDVWVTVTTVDEALAARDAGADALVVQGYEAGGHRSTWDDDRPGDIALLPLVQLVRAAVGDGMPLVATGGLQTGAAVAAVLVAGAAAAQLGSAFLLCPEAGTAPAYRELLTTSRERTAITRAFSGRSARGVVNRFMRDHDAQAPSAYPEVHHLTAPLRAAARQRGDADGFNVWAGQAYPLARTLPAAEVVSTLGLEARRSLADAATRGTSQQRPRDRHRG